jgi:hypothetical protein
MAKGICIEIVHVGVDFSCDVSKLSSDLRALEIVVSTV